MAFWDVDHRKAEVEIVNQTEQKILSVSVVHKYSDNYVNEHTWGIVEPNGSSSPPLTVDYHTGALTTGRDWWLVSWLEEDGNAYMTSPQNFRELFDAIESGLVKAKDLIKNLGESLRNKPDDKAQAAGIAMQIINKIVQPLLNNSKTAGFKQHILRAEDADKTTQILLFNEKVRFKSNSGESETQVHKIS